MPSSKDTPAMDGGKFRPHWVSSKGYRSCLGGRTAFPSGPRAHYVTLTLVARSCDLPDASLSGQASRLNEGLV